MSVRVARCVARHTRRISGARRRPGHQWRVPAGHRGSALALQTAAGFLLTGVTIALVRLLSGPGGPGWQLAFALLAAGRLVGILAMGRLRGRPDAARTANGNR